MTTPRERRRAHRILSANVIEMVSGPTGRGSGDEPLYAILLGWAHTLYEPMLPTRTRARVESDFAAAHRKNPERLNLFFAGLIAEAMSTLPESDVWTTKLSARWNSVTVGDHPPEHNGTVYGDAGQVFGTWRNAADLLDDDEVRDPFDDPRTVGFAEDLSPAASAILASGTGGTRACMTMIQEVWNVGEQMPDSERLMPFGDDPEYLAAHRLSFARAAAFDALRWVILRRRQWIHANDAWAEDASGRWAWRCTRPEVTWTKAQIAEESAPWKIRDFTHIYDEDESL